MYRDDKPAAHLAEVLSATAESPRYALFMGAGASVTSGVPLAATMIERWRTEYSARFTDAESELEKQPWHRSIEEYSQLFEALYDHPSQRREYIEQLLCRAEPSWGYAYLASLLTLPLFRIVFTTNFDDLLNESCHLFTNNVRPVVCSHDAGISSIRITRDRPAILKLHGDYLYDNIKNTSEELISLDTNMNRKLAQVSREYGLVVIGYSGNDQSIMGPLTHLMSQPDTFPYGVYWCHTADKLPWRVRQLSAFPRFRCVRISSFDDFMADLHRTVLGGPPEFVTAPTAFIRRRMVRMINSLVERGASLPRTSAEDLCSFVSALQCDFDLSDDKNYPRSAIARIAANASNYSLASSIMTTYLPSAPLITDVIDGLEYCIHDDSNSHADILVNTVLAGSVNWDDRHFLVFDLVDVLVALNRISDAIGVLMTATENAAKQGQHKFDDNLATIYRLALKVISGKSLTQKEYRLVGAALKSRKSTEVCKATARMLVSDQTKRHILTRQEIKELSLRSRGVVAALAEVRQK